MEKGHAQSIKSGATLYWTHLASRNSIQRHGYSPVHAAVLFFVPFLAKT